MPSIAIDLGTANTRIFIPRKGITMDEPSVIAIDSKTREVLAIGTQARDMLGKTSKKVDVVFPLAGGRICDYYLIEAMLKYFLKKVKISRFIMPKAVICIPGEITDIQKMAAISAIESAGIRRVYVMETPIAAAIGSGVEIVHPKGSLIINIGAGTTDIAIVSLNGLVSSVSLRVAGDAMDEMIMRYIKDEYNMVIGKRTAENIKIQIGSLFPDTEEVFFKAKGKAHISGTPKFVNVSSTEIHKILMKVADKILSGIVNVLEVSAPDLVGDILGQGVSLSGGCSKIPGFKELIGKKINVDVSLVDDPFGCVVKGAGESIKYACNNAKNYGYINPLNLEE